MLGASAVLRDPAGECSPAVIMREIAEGTDRYGADVVPTGEGLWHFRVEAWGDPFAHWRHDCSIKVPIGQDVDLMLAEGALLFDRAAVLARGDDPPSPTAVLADQDDQHDKDTRAARKLFESVARTLRDAKKSPVDRLGVAFSSEVTQALAEFPVRDLMTHSAWSPLIVHRQRALYGSWYEFFPRSEGAKIDPLGRRKPVSGTLATAARRLDAIARMGFDVVYLPPIHPIGTTARKGKNNALIASEADPGSPWAIGSPEGGHAAVHPDLGTITDFDEFVARAKSLGLEVAMDLALQASPDHPWVAKHPEWFTTRADGSIAYAENPPKKYQDIYPLNFDNDPEGIYAEVLALVRFWMDHGIRIFRVDNPHTKPLPFWQRLLAEIATTDPDVIFLAEAFTRPAMMHALAAVGFHQSYTYFTWRNSAAELTEYGKELAGPAAHYMRPNFFVNTPDILSKYLQHAGPPAFAVRAVLAAMLSPSWGVYSGYELCENIPLVPGSEEYLDSEKYAYRPRDWDRAAALGLTIAPLLTRLNAIRRAHPALHELRNLRFHYSDQPDILIFSKRTTSPPMRTTSPPMRTTSPPMRTTSPPMRTTSPPMRTTSPPTRTTGAPLTASGDFPVAPDTVLVVVNLNPNETREATVWLDSAALGLDAAAGFKVIDELTDQEFSWGQANYVRLDPAVAPAHILTVAQ